MQPGTPCVARVEISGRTRSSHILSFPAKCPHASRERGLESLSNATHSPSILKNRKRSSDFCPPPTPTQSGFLERETLNVESCALGLADIVVGLPILGLKRQNKIVSRNPDFSAFRPDSTIKRQPCSDENLSAGGLISLAR